jgi:hypothetical protein
MVFWRRAPKHISQGYNINEDILSELKFISDVKKFRNDRNKWIHVRRMDTRSLIVKCRALGKEAKDDPSKDF